MERVTHVLGPNGGGDHSRPQKPLGMIPGARVISVAPSALSEGERGTRDGQVRDVLSRAISIPPVACKMDLRRAREGTQCPEILFRDPSGPADA